MTRQNLQLGMALFGLGMTWASGAEAQLAPGQWYAVEGWTNSVVEFTAGGDLTNVPRLATGIPGISALCFGGPSHDLYAVSPNHNAVYRITSGGDFTGAMPYAWELPKPTPDNVAFALDCTGERVLVALDSGQVYDVTAGGDMSAATPFATGFAGGAVDIYTDSSGTVWLSSQGVGLYDITLGGDFTELAPRHAYDIGGPYGQSQVVEAGGKLLFANIYPGAIYDFTALEAGDPLSESTVFATGLTLLTSLASDGTKLYALDPAPGWNVGVGTIWDATAGGDLSEAMYAWYSNPMAYFAEDLAYIHGCGDLIVWPNSSEECDEGGVESTTCNANCTIPACGDGTLNVTDGEVCDDGELNSDTAADACRTDCTEPSCGDGAVDTGEECDDGELNSNTEASACRTDCTEHFCGDGVVDSDEACDDGELNSDTEPGACRTSCQAGSCGDGMLDDGEECDEGIYNSNSVRNACRSDCTSPRCGDGVVDSGEQCDDGNAEGDDGCSAECQWDYPEGAGGSGEGGSGEGGQGGTPVTPTDDEPEDEGGCSLSGAPTGHGGRGLGLAGLGLTLAAFARVRRRR